MCTYPPARCSFAVPCSVVLRSSFFVYYVFCPLSSVLRPSSVADPSFHLSISPAPRLPSAPASRIPPTPTLTPTPTPTPAEVERRLDWGSVGRRAVFSSRDAIRCAYDDGTGKTGRGRREDGDPRGCVARFPFVPVFFFFFCLLVAAAQTCVRTFVDSFVRIIVSALTPSPSHSTCAARMHVSARAHAAWDDAPELCVRFIFFHSVFHSLPLRFLLFGLAVSFVLLVRVSFDRRFMLVLAPATRLLFFRCVSR